VNEAAALKKMLRAQFEAIVAHAPGARAGRDPEELHDLRVAVRRLRALLRAGRGLLEPGWGDRLRDELDWLGRALGPARDVDVLLARLEETAAELGEPDSRSFEPVLQRVRRERSEARAEMLRVLRSARYRRLVDTLDEATATPRLRDDRHDVTGVARREFRKLRRAVSALPAQPADDELHAVRIRGKRARYAAELAASADGGGASGRFVRKAKELQDVLGQHQDATVAEARLRKLAGRTGARAALAAGRLVEHERRRKLAARNAFPEAWQRLERSGRKAWK
jgi:CHAD domain-containing protein